MKEHEKKKKSVWTRVLRVALILALAGLLCYGGLIGMVYYKETHVPAPSDYDSIVVLGAQVLPTGEPSVQLRWRLDKAIEMYHASPSPIVVCGAQGRNEPAPEGQIMRELLIADGLPPEQIHADTVSDDTQANIQNAVEILKGLGCSKPLIVTSDYHLPRALALAEDEGLHPQGVGSPCKPDVSFWLKNHMREALAWVKYWGEKYLGLSL